MSDTTNRGNNREAIQLDMLEFLVSPQVQVTATQLAHLNFPDDATNALLTLRKQYTPEQAGALLALVRLRQNAQEKFPDAARLYFTQDALEQATAYPIAAYRAEKLHKLAPPGAILDLGSGIGGDTLALARRRHVHAFEQDPLRCALLRANVTALGLDAQITVHNADWYSALADDRLPPAVGAFLDPPRRAEGRRLMRLGQILPTWAPIRALLSRVGRVCLKLMPGIDDAEIPADAAVEFISHAGVCKESNLWLGLDIRESAGQETGGRQASVPARLAAVHTAENWHTLAASGRQPPIGPLEAGQVLYEPDPAVIRAGPFDELCRDLNLHLFDAQIAYLMSNTPGAKPVATPFATVFQIEEVHPYALKLLNARVQALGIGTVELKKRGVPFAPESLRGRIKLVSGGRAAVVFFTRRGNTRLMLIAHRISA
ncbi:MAG: hypothetical protein WDZ49_07665 [Litorilinea sp.]